MANWTLCSLLFKTDSSYEKNLQTLEVLINDTPTNSLIVAPEVCLTGFDYDNFTKAEQFSTKALGSLKKNSQDKIIILTLIQKIDGGFFNVLTVIHNGKVVHERAKARLFILGGEEKYFTQGKDSEIQTMTVAGMKIAFLVCFELRFKDLWQKCEGADVIAVPSWWGQLRSEHFISLTKSLAIMNQCYVVASDAKNEECSKMSGIITPLGKEQRNGNSPCLKQLYEPQEIKKMRRYLNVGIR